MDWAAYVKHVIGDDRQKQVAAKTGIDQTTISRWLSPSSEETHRRTPQSVSALARGYGRSVLEAFVVAGFITEEEAGVKPPRSGYVDLTRVPTADLLGELTRRHKAFAAGKATTTSRRMSS